MGRKKKNTERKEQPQIPGNRKYKSNVFSMLMQEKEHALSVYNALNGSCYDSPDEVKIRMLDGGIFLSIRNDASFLLANTLNIYEHQSTYCPNMPLRQLLYVSSILPGLVHDRNIFGERLVKIPTPKFVTFYNGTKERPEREVMRLSDAFETPTDHPELELECTVININKGYNTEFLAKCPVLEEYTEFVYRVREYAQAMPLGQALVRAIDECIREYILEDFLQKQRMEVINMTLLEYRLEDQIKFARQEGMQEGIDLGRREGIDLGRTLKVISLICHKLQKGKTPERIADELEMEYCMVRNICEIATEYAPEYDCEEICRHLPSNITERL